MTASRPMDDRSRLARRLAAELDDPETAERVVAGLEDWLVDLVVTATGGAIEGSPLLSCTPATMPDEQVEEVRRRRADPKARKLTLEEFNERLRRRLGE